MAEYEIDFKESVRKDLRKVPKSNLKKILSRIQKLKDNPPLLFGHQGRPPWQSVVIVVPPGKKPWTRKLEDDRDSVPVPPEHT